MKCIESLNTDCIFDDIKDLILIFLCHNGIESLRALFRYIGNIFLDI